MSLTLTAGEADPAGAVSLLETVSGYIYENLDGSPGPVTIHIEGDYKAAREEARLAYNDSASAVASAGFHSALFSLHRAGRLLACLSDGNIGGIWLEIALASDLHLMTSGSRLAPAGLLDTHRPLAGGWARLIDRTGGSRAAALLMNAWGETLSPDAAFRAGLTDRVVDDAADGMATLNRANGAPGATRLAGELCDRTAGLTPRQARLMERASFALAFSSTDPRKGIEAFFSGRPVDWTPGN